MPVYIASLVALLSGEETNAPYEKITEIETLDPLLIIQYTGCKEKNGPPFPTFSDFIFALIASI